MHKQIGQKEKANAIAFVSVLIFPFMPIGSHCSLDFPRLSGEHGLQPTLPKEMRARRR